MPAELRPFEPIGSAEARLLLLHADADRRRAEWLPELEPRHRGQQPTRHELADEPDPRLAAIPDVGAEVHLQVNFRSEEHTSELQSRFDLVCRLLLEKK